MYLVLMKGHNYSYEIFEMLTIYYPMEKIDVVYSIDSIKEDSKIIKSVIEIEDNVICKSELIDIKNGECSITASETVILEPWEDMKKCIKHCVKLSLFKLLKKVTGIEMPWGILVGIRPSKIVNELKLNGTSSEDIKFILKDRYMVRDDKIRLVMDVSSNSFKFINNDKRNISVYIGIPFCPSRCIYCSFASYPISSYMEYVEKYIMCLKYEVKRIKEFISGKFNVESIYVGGGTPTSLSDSNFTLLMDIISENFNTKCIREFTVEAGRPDTIDSLKLEAMAKSGVSRISINPQTMNDVTLKTIGRNHCVRDIIDKYEMAREKGFVNINMDMIVGLPGESAQDVVRTVEELINLGPENITVHSMAVKRASRLKENIIEHKYFDIPERSVAEECMDEVQQRLYGSMYIPYYMYRQKMMVGNLENVGFCKRGFESIYNIEMIEEKQTIIGIGVDAVTKYVFLDENRIERLANKKDIKEYINTIHESTDKKIEMLSLLT